MLPADWPTQNPDSQMCSTNAFGCHITFWQVLEVIQESCINATLKQEDPRLNRKKKKIQREVHTNWQGSYVRLVILPFLLFLFTFPFPRGPGIRLSTELSVQIFSLRRWISPMTWVTLVLTFCNCICVVNHMQPHWTRLLTGWVNITTPSLSCLKVERLIWILTGNTDSMNKPEM